MDKFLVEKYYLVRLKKLQGEVTDNDMRNIIGYAPYLPTPSQPFVMFGRKEDGTLRVIKTSPVQMSMVLKSEELSFDCETKSYHITILDEASPEEVEEFLNESIIKRNPAIDSFMARLDVEPKTLN